MRSCSATCRSICGARPRRERRSPSLSTASPSPPGQPRLGLWEVWLKPEPAGGPFTLTVRGSSELTRSDLLVGDVWFASGQSNMEMPLAGFPPSAHVTNADQEIAQADLPQVRLLRMEHQSSAFASGRHLCRLANVHPGDRQGLLCRRLLLRPRDSAGANMFPSESSTPPGEVRRSIPGSASTPSPPTRRSCPPSRRAPTSPTCRPIWSSLNPPKSAPTREAEAHHLPAPPHPWHPDPSSWVPAGLYNGMVAPFTPYAIKGFLWYQGETDSAPDRANLYAELLPTLIADWRRQWG